jgi:hypothetical protein
MSNWKAKRSVSPFTTPATGAVPSSDSSVPVTESPFWVIVMTEGCSPPGVATDTFHLPVRSAMMRGAAAATLATAATSESEARRRRGKDMAGLWEMGRT